jgi:hypothetical protein
MTHLNREVKVLDRNVDVREDETFLDVLPHDARHFIAIHFDYGVLDGDLGARGQGSGHGAVMVSRDAAQGQRSKTQHAESRSRRGGHTRYRGAMCKVGALVQVTVRQPNTTGKPFQV